VADDFGLLATPRINIIGLYGLGAIAAEKTGSNDHVLIMYFMARITLGQIGPVEDIASGFRVSLRDLEKELSRLGDKIRALGVDADQDPRIFMRTRIAMAGDTSLLWS
jgi:hypothetical protein